MLRVEGQNLHVEALGAGYNARQAICSKTIFSAPAQDLSREPLMVSVLN